MLKEVALFKALSDPTRLGLAILLAIHGDTCVCHLATAVNEPEFKVSRHLGILRSTGMVEARRDGTWMYYRLAEPRSDMEGFLQDCFRRRLITHPKVREYLDCLERAVCTKPCKRTGRLDT
jgi:DNA-binding transcriptional ArsR family regulator